jgi:hypothetical protein
MPLLATGRFFSAGAGGGGGLGYDPYDNEVVLLTDVGNGFYPFDQAYVQGPFTISGPTIVSGDSQFGTYAMSFDGVNDRYTLPDVTNWHPSGAYTWEAWIKPTGPIQAGTIASFYQSTGSQNSWRFGVNTDTGLGTATIHFIYVEPPGLGNDAFTYSSTSAGVIADQWNHVAVCYDGVNELRFFINGVLDANIVTLPGVFTDRTASLRIGSSFTGGVEASFFKGLIDERGLRLTKGVARYTSSFVPERFYIPRNKSLLAVNFTGANGSTSFTDIGPYARTLTAVGNAQIQSNKLELDGSGDYVTVPDSSLFTLSGTDFTIEAFGVQADAFATAATLVSKYNSSGSARAWIFQLSGTGLSYSSWSDGSTLSDSLGAPTTITIGNVYDLAVVREGTTVSLYIDGVLFASGTFDAQTADTSALLVIGAQASPANYLNGRLSAVRITKGALYSGASYTIPSLPITAIVP